MQQVDQMGFELFVKKTRQWNRILVLLCCPYFLGLGWIWICKSLCGPSIVERSKFRGQIDDQDTWQRYWGCIKAKYHLLLVKEEVKSAVQCGIQQVQFKRIRNSESNRFNLGEVLAFRAELADQFTARISIFRKATDCFKLGAKAEIMEHVSLCWSNLLQMAFDS